jgi:hypothetical protein
VYPRYLLILTALLEGLTALPLLLLPSLPLALLLGVENATAEALFVGRVLGAALLAIAIACWLASGDPGGPAQRGVVIGVLIYDTGAASLLAYAALGLGLSGVVLWPAVVLHGALTAWCLAGLWARLRGGFKVDARG